MAMQVLALCVLQADRSFLCLCSRLSECCVPQGATAELVSMDWSGAKMCSAIWQHSRVSLCLPKSCTHTMTYPHIEMRLRQFNPPEFASIIAPTCSEKQVGNLIFTILPLQMTPCLFIGQRITLSLMMSLVMPHGGRSQQDTASIRQGRKDCSGTLIRIKKDILTG